MKTLLYKQLRLVCHPMTPLFCLFGVMVLIPNYPYTVIFFYVTLGLFFTFLNMELASLVLLALFSVLAVHLQPEKDNLVGLDPNITLLAAGLLIYAVFNAVFLPSFYANGYKVGTAYLKAVIPTVAVMAVCEALPHFPRLTWLDELDRAAQLRQLPLLVGGILIYAGGMALTLRASEKLYEKVDL